MTELYNLVNVPSGIWVDEEGRVLRINEGAYTGFRQIGSSTKDYLPLVRDWVANGAKSPYIWSPQEMAKRIRKHTSDEALADPTFKLGVYFFERDEPRARQYLGKGAGARAGQLELPPAGLDWCRRACRSEVPREARRARRQAVLRAAGHTEDPLTEGPARSRTAASLC